MDISSHLEMMDKGHRYYDFDGNEVNIIDFAKEQGFNYGRLRIWNEPGRVKESGGYCDLEHTRKMAAEIKNRGLGLLLDFHYSDWWADPGNQTKPAAWQELGGDALAQAVYDYTREVLTALYQDGVYPDMVQVGNEIRCGMLWPDGRTDNWEELAKLINAGIDKRTTQRLCVLSISYASTAPVRIAFLRYRTRYSRRSLLCVYTIILIMELIAASIIVTNIY